MLAVLKNPNRSFFIRFSIVILLDLDLEPFFDYEDEEDNGDEFFAASPTRSKITSAMCGSGADGGRIPDQLAVFLRRIAPRRLAGGKTLCSTIRFASPSKTGMSSCVCRPSLMKNGTTIIFFVCASE